MLVSAFKRKKRCIPKETLKGKLDIILEDVILDHTESPSDLCAKYDVHTWRRESIRLYTVTISKSTLSHQDFLRPLSDVLPFTNNSVRIIFRHRPSTVLRLPSRSVRVTRWGKGRKVWRSGTFTYPLLPIRLSFCLRSWFRGNRLRSYKWTVSVGHN